jgi:formyltetrahydrofolate-dependent phosphoribosylglycinamide formyltransferase
MRQPSIAVLISGSGRSLENLVMCQRRGQLAGEISLVIASSRRCAGVARAQHLGLEVAILGRRPFSDDAEYSAAVVNILETHKIDLAVLAGFLKKFIPPSAWKGRVINIHPSLLPAFGGQGFFGHHVHEAVYERGCRVSGCTVHFVDEQYDAGPIILQEPVMLESEDTPERIAQKVFALECQVLPRAVNLVLSQTWKIQDKRVLIKH